MNAFSWTFPELKFILLSIVRSTSQKTNFQFTKRTCQITLLLYRTTLFFIPFRIHNLTFWRLVPTRNKAETVFVPFVSTMNARDESNEILNYNIHIITRSVTIVSIWFYVFLTNDYMYIIQAELIHLSHIIKLYCSMFFDTLVIK